MANKRALIFIILSFILLTSLILTSGLEINDYNKDNKINIFDLVLSLNSGLLPGDINHDGKVNILDLAEAARRKVSILKLAEIGLNLNKIYPQQASKQNPDVFIEPNESKVAIEDKFTIKAEINTDAEVFALEFELFYNNSLLEILKAEEGDFLKKDSSKTYPVIKINKSKGKVSFADTRFGTQTGVKGQGTLANFTFKALSQGESKLEIKNLKLVDPNLQEIYDVQVKDGLVVIEPKCKDECKEGEKRCVGNFSQTCGDYDEDSCLEWGNSILCEYGCENGNIEKVVDGFNDWIKALWKENVK